MIGSPFLPSPKTLRRSFASVPSCPPISQVWADAYILVFASAADLKLVTFDQALKSRSDKVVVL
jgi:hypothetical protein